MSPSEDQGLRKEVRARRGPADWATRPRFWVWIACAVLGAALVVVLPKLDVVEQCKEGCAIRYTDYATLYFPEEVPRVEGFDTSQGDRLTLRLSPAPARRWRVEAGEGSSYTSDKTHPTLRLEPGVQRYHVESVDGRSEARDDAFDFGVTVTYVPGEAADDGKARQASHVVSNATLPLGHFKRHPLRKLTYAVEDFPEAEVQDARKLLGEMGIRAEDPSWLRMEKIAAFMSSQLDDRRGVPTEAAGRMSPLQQYESARAGGIQLWCANFAAIYSFFATVAGVPTRLVTVKAALDGVSLSGHTFAESYIEEKRQWAYADLTFRTVYVQNAKGDFLNGVQVVRMFESNSDDGVVATLVGAGEIRKGRDPEEERFIRLHLDANGTMIFHWPYSNRYAFGSRVHRLVLEPEMAHTANGAIMADGRTLAWLIREGSWFGAVALALGVLGQRLWRRRARRRSAVDA